MPSDARPVETHVLYIGESATTYCFDFQDDPQVGNDETLSSPSVSITEGNSLVTLGTPTVLTADFVDYDRDGVAEETVPSGKGVKVTVTPSATRSRSTIGQCTVTCLVTLSGGGVRAKKANFKVE